MRRAVALCVVAVLAGQGCVLYGLESVPCSADADCPSALGCVEGACRDRVAVPGVHPVATERFDGDGAWPPQWSCGGVASGRDSLGDGVGQLGQSDAGRYDCTIAIAGDLDLRVDVDRPARVDAANRGVLAGARRSQRGNLIDELTFVVVDAGLPGAECDGLCASFVEVRAAAADAAKVVKNGADGDGASVGGNSVVVEPGGRLSLRVRVETAGATTIRARGKVWSAGVPEPAPWTVDVTVDDTAGTFLGGTASLGLAATDDADAIASFDDFAAFRTTDLSPEVPAPDPP